MFSSYFQYDFVGYEIPDDPKIFEITIREGSSGAPIQKIIENKFNDIEVFRDRWNSFIYRVDWKPVEVIFIYPSDNILWRYIKESQFLRLIKDGYFEKLNIENDLLKRFNLEAANQYLGKRDLDKKIRRKEFFNCYHIMMEKVSRVYN